MSREAPGEFEQLVLLAILRRKRDAYGVNVAREIERRTGREVSRAAVYVALRRLEQKGLVEAELGEPTAQRGGRAKRYFRVTAEGLGQMRSSRAALLRMWDGVEPLLEGS